MMTSLFRFPRLRRGAAAQPRPELDGLAHTPAPRWGMSDWQIDLDDVFYGLVADRRPTGRWWQGPDTSRTRPRGQG